VSANEQLPAVLSVFVCPRLHPTTDPQGIACQTWTEIFTKEHVQCAHVLLLQLSC
jgi:hypothetical protein